MSYDSTIHAKAVDIAKLNYEITAAAGSGHPTSGASLAHLVTVLMYQHMRYEPANPGHICSDRLVLSEGHAVPILYAACADLGVRVGKNPEDLKPLTREMAMTLREIDSLVDGHPNPVEGFPFFDAATGSLGQGLSVAAGLAIAAKLDGLDKRIFCIMGDGESREGQVWEAVDFLRDENLKAVLPIFNCNVFAQSDEVSPQQSADVLAAKLAAAGFDVKVIDGHAPSEILAALEAHAAGQNNDEAPIAIVAKTVKGWGSASQQGNGHHGQPAKGEGLTVALDELAATGRQLGAIMDTPLKIGLMTPGKPQAPANTDAPSFTEALKQFGMESVLESGKMATRNAYGVALRALGHSRPNVVALDADVRGSTGAVQFYKDEALNSRFVDCRIAEQNMVSVAAGLSAAGKVPCVSTFAKFLTRAYDQIEMSINSGASIKLVGSHAGITLGADGPSQMGMPDVSWFRSFTTMKTAKGNPGFYLLQPSDAYQAYQLLLKSADYDGSVYMRTARPDAEFLYSDNVEFKLGGHEVLAEGRDLLIIAAGYMVHEANKALDLLDAQGIDATLVDLYSLPFDADAILDLANENNGMILTLEDNYGGGIGSAIADAVSADGGGFNVKQMFCQQLPKSGKSGDEILKLCGLDAPSVVKQAMSLLELTGA
ncbi:MAG TPA: transketolase [Phycisphaerales bacterium]|nr:transketolase [Phycisphaerales bacterium]HCD35122.1 transketolase [Phycisphaerales bacterium]|tara:strand:+ start:50292 stop:52259 length:1968 start_codon:yes stop_codon:yes gene_type:complete